MVDADRTITQSAGRGALAGASVTETVIANNPHGMSICGLMAIRAGLTDLMAEPVDS